MNKHSGDQGFQAYRILRFAFIVAPLLAGLDKFFYLMINWSQYISPFVLNIMQGHDRGFMGFVGVVEIVAGLGVYFRPKIFSYIVALWLFGIIVNLLLTGQYFDIALRDLGLCLGAFALGKLSVKYA